MEEKLITVVSGFPELYDPSLLLYRDKNKKNDAWRKVGDFVCCFSVADDCKKKWKNLRDTYRRERKKERESCRSGAEASTHRPWRYSQIMGFLNPFLEDRATSSNYPSVAREMQGDAGEEEERGEDALFSQLSSEADLFTLFLDHLMGAIQAAAQFQPPDPDRQFFEGLLPDLKALSERKKAEVKFQIHRIIHEATCARLDGEE
uniref:MADF domain-containing protein n=1 Tax=Myripristis murdjan TaxID=586833 RepID=A0A667X0S8_9TELE